MALFFELCPVDPAAGGVATTQLGGGHLQVNDGFSLEAGGFTFEKGPWESTASLLK